MVMILIGANNYHFADLIQSCVLDWLTSPSWWKNYCNDDSSVKANFTASNVATQTTNIKNAILNIRQAMANDGYADSAYTLMVQTYWSPLPPASGIRYPETGWTRQSVGGCGVWNADANWANNTALATFNSSVRSAVTQAGLSNTKILDAQNALVGHRLCEKTVGLLEEKGLTSWTNADGVGQDGVGQPDPHHVDAVRPVPAARGLPRELLGPARHAELRPPGVQRRFAAWRRVHAGHGQGRIR